MVIPCPTPPSIPASLLGTRRHQGGPRADSACLDQLQGAMNWRFVSICFHFLLHQAAPQPSVDCVPDYPWPRPRQDPAHLVATSCAEGTLSLQLLACFFCQ